MFSFTNYSKIYLQPKSLYDHEKNRRFEIISNLLLNQQPHSILDLGCGYKQIYLYKIDNSNLHLTDIDLNIVFNDLNHYSKKKNINIKKNLFDFSKSIENQIKTFGNIFNSCNCSFASAAISLSRRNNLMSGCLRITPVDEHGASNKMRSYSSPSHHSLL